MSIVRTVEDEFRLAVYSLAMRALAEPRRRNSKKR